MNRHERERESACVREKRTKENGEAAPIRDDVLEVLYGVHGTVPSTQLYSRPSTDRRRLKAALTARPIGPPPTLVAFGKVLIAPIITAPQLLLLASTHILGWIGW